MRCRAFNSNVSLAVTGEGNSVSKLPLGGHMLTLGLGNTIGYGLRVPIAADELILS